MAEIIKPEEALKCLDCAINFVPNSAQLYMQRAIVKENLKDFKAIIQLNPDDVEAKKAYVSIKANQSENGLQCLKCTLKTGEQVNRFIIDGDVIDIPADQY